MDFGGFDVFLATLELLADRVQNHPLELLMHALFVLGAAPH